ncbi:hypothetical protein ACS0TY_033419 [Phlomoides rotata]
MEGEIGCTFSLKPSPETRRFCQKRQNHHHRLIPLQPLQEFIYHDRQSPRGQKRKDPEKKKDDKEKTSLVHTKDREQPP